MVDFSPEKFGTAVAGQVFYIAVLALTAYLIFRTALKKIHVQGG